MTAMWFGLAAIALVGAIVLLYFDRVQRQRTGHARQVWAKSQGYTYVSVEPALASTWRRGALAKLGYLSAVDVVSGIRKGEKFVLFDLEDAATLVAVRRQIGSDIDVDMRLKTASPPKDADLELLGAIGDRVVFATNPEIARHAVDQRMVAFIETLPDTVQMLWSEGNWTLGMLNVGTTARDWETTIDAVLRLSGLLHVLPPVSDVFGMDSGDHDPGRPHPRTRGKRHDGTDEHGEPEGSIGVGRVQPSDTKKGTDSYDDSAYRDSVYEESAYRADDDESEYEETGFDKSGYKKPRYDAAGYDDEDEEPEQRAPAASAAQEPPRRPSLAVVPDSRSRPREGRWPADAEWRETGDESEDRPTKDRREQTSRVTVESDDEWPPIDEAPEPPGGGPFHPGFRPYQGPVPQ
ncbi:hypothetical protein ACLMAJ_08710 [Nocardia sp. KC 131]|uniref:hypothetical protein n=1 Tax=Nocardia arseniciresistens TaxID=3392119 RepID=UPI00398EFFF4